MLILNKHLIHKLNSHETGQSSRNNNSNHHHHHHHLSWTWPANKQHNYITSTIYLTTLKHHKKHIYITSPPLCLSLTGLNIVCFGCFTDILTPQLPSPSANSNAEPRVHSQIPPFFPIKVHYIGYELNVSAQYNAPLRKPFETQQETWRSRPRSCAAANGNTVIRWRHQGAARAFVFLTISSCLSLKWRHIYKLRTLSCLNI